MQGEDRRVTRMEPSDHPWRTFPIGRQDRCDETNVRDCSARIARQPFDQGRRGIHGYSRKRAEACQQDREVRVGSISHGNNYRAPSIASPELSKSHHVHDPLDCKGRQQGSISNSRFNAGQFCGDARVRLERAHQPVFEHIAHP